MDDENNITSVKYQCTTCLKLYSAKQNVLRHVRAAHSQEGPPKKANNETDSNYQCPTCGKLLSSKFSLSKHVRNLHSADIRPGKIQKFHMDKTPFRCLQCTVSFISNPKLRMHLTIEHDFQMETEKLNFNSFEELNKWVDELPERDLARYLGGIGRISETRPVCYYNCHRSGLRGDKLGHACTSQIVVRRINDSQLEATYYKTHYGHSLADNDRSLNRKRKILTPFPAGRLKCETVIDESNESVKYKCTVCEKLFEAKSSVWKHVRNFHSILGQHRRVRTFHKDKTMCRCLECSISVSNTAYLRLHLATQHNFNIETESLNFSSFEDVQKWVDHLPERDFARYIRGHGMISMERPLFYFKCHLSGVKEPKKGRKLGHACTSQIVVRRISDSQFEVTYYKTHYGHTPTNDVGSLKLDKEEREDIALQIASGVPVATILKNCSSGFTRAHINNISQLRNLNEDQGVRDPDEVKSLEIWVADLKLQPTNPVLFWKPSGSQHPSFEDQDVALIFLNPFGHSKVLEYICKFVAVSCIDNHEGDKFRVTVVITTDEWDQGVPVAFLISNRKDAFMNEFFFMSLKARFGAILTKVFVSTKSHGYLEAWRKVMGPVELKLRCRRDVDQSWKSKFKHIKDIKKREEIKQGLEVIRSSVNPQQLQTRLDNFLQSLEDDPSLERFYQYFKDEFLHDFSDWVDCYRKYSGINVDGQVPILMELVKRVRRQGVKLISVDKAIFSTLVLLRKLAIDDALKLPTIFDRPHLHQISTSHRAAVFMTCSVTTTDTNRFIVTVNSEQFIVKRKVGTFPCCRLQCSDCQLCVHSMVCSCYDSTFRIAICEHVHAVIVNSTPDLAKHKSSDPSPVDNEIVDDIIEELTKLRSANLGSIRDDTFLYEVLDSLEGLNAAVSKRLASSESSHNEPIKKRRIRIRKRKLDEFKKELVKNYNVVEEILDGNNILISNNSLLDHQYF